MKKLLISTLVAAMCLAVGSTAFAATVGAIQPAAFTDIAGHEAEGALTLLGALGVYGGDSGLGGKARPDDPITRAEFCKVVVTAFGRASTAAGLAGLQPTFTDGASIPTWAWGYVNVAVYMGIIKGYADGSFGANNPVTYAEAVTMLIRAVPGHVAQVGAGVWPYNYLFYGVDNGFTGNDMVGDVDVGFANLPATRGDVARMVVATMCLEKLDKDGLPAGGEKLFLFKDVVVDYDATSVYFPDGDDADTNPDGVALAEKVWLVGAKTYEDLRNLPVFGALDADAAVYFMQVAGEANVVTGEFKALDDADEDGLNDTIVLTDGTKVPYVEDTTGYNAALNVTLNREPTFTEGELQAADAVSNRPGDELVISLGSDGKAVNVVATRFDHLVDWISADVVKSEDYDPDDSTTWTQITCNSFGSYVVPKTCAVTINGEAKTPDDLAENDVVMVAQDNTTGDPYIIRAHREVVEGTVANTSTTWPGGVRHITIDLKAGGSKTFTVNDLGDIVGLPGKGDVVKYGLDADGKLCVAIGYEGLTPFVLVKSFVVNGDGTASATVDVRGTEVTYKVADSFIDNDGDGERDPSEVTLYGCFMDNTRFAEGYGLVWIEVDGATNTIIDVAEPLAADDWYVLANTGGALTLGNDFAAPDTYDFIPADAGITVYQYDPDTEVYSYIAVEKLTVTDDFVLVRARDCWSFGFDDGTPDAVPGGLLWVWAPLM